MARTNLVASDLHIVAVAVPCGFPRHARQAQHKVMEATEQSKLSSWLSGVVQACPPSPRKVATSRATLTQSEDEDEVTRKVMSDTPSIPHIKTSQNHGIAPLLGHMHVGSDQLGARVNHKTKSACCSSACSHYSLDPPTKVLLN